MSRPAPLENLRDRISRSRVQPQPSIFTSDEKLTMKQSPIVSSPIVSSPVTTVYEEEEEEEEDEGVFENNNEYQGGQDEEDDDSSMYSSSSSIPDENINFDLVYALHTFVATVDGQASVVKGDAMTLLDDSNSYWWLIRALKTAEVGYIPAENIETPFERLARLNKHRNVEVTSLGQLEHYQTAPEKKNRVKKKVKVSRELACQLQIVLTDEDDEDIYEEAFERWDEDMSSEAYRDHEEEVDEEDEEDTPVDEKKYTPLLNPDFNKPINVSASSPLTDIVQTTALQKPLPTLQPENTVQESTPEKTPQELPQQQQQQHGKVTGLKRLLSIGKKNKPSLVDSITETNNNTQYHVLRVFAGNINVGALFCTVALTPDMNADQLVKIALEKFHIPLLDESNKANEGIEYYLTVKSMDSDEKTLLPQDKPLAIFESLSDHLTTPMPSLTYIKRLSMEQPTIKVTRVGVSKARQRAKARFGEDSVIRFALHKRIKRTIETSGQIYVKISYHVDNKKHHRRLLSSQQNSPTKISSMGLIRKSSLLRVDQQIQQQQQSLLQAKAKQERIDKLVAVSLTTEMAALTQIAIEKFHLTEEDPALYFIALSVNGNETTMNGNRTISDVLNDSKLIPNGMAEKLFVLRKIASSESTNQSDPSNRRFMRFLKQDKDSSRSLESEQSSDTSTGSVLKRLDTAIQSLENDMRQFESGLPHIKVIPKDNKKVKTKNRSNSVPKHPPTDDQTLPTRSSSLKINKHDAFDTVNRNEFSNMEDLEQELKRIATSHSSASVRS